MSKYKRLLHFGAGVLHVLNRMTSNCTTPISSLTLQNLIFGGDCSSERLDWRNPKKSRRERSLTSALGNIIWRAGDGHGGEERKVQTSWNNLKKML